MEETGVSIASRSFGKKYDSYFNLYHGQIQTCTSTEIFYINVKLFDLTKNTANI